MPNAEICRQRKLAGLCLSCGSRFSAPNHFTCQTCLDIKRPKQRAKMLEKQKKNRHAGLCFCGRPPMFPWKSCQTCRERCVRKGDRMQALTGRRGIIPLWKSDILAQGYAIGMELEEKQKST